MAQERSTTTVDFKIKNLGSYVPGTFDTAKVQASFDKTRLQESFIMAQIPVITINTGNNKRDRHLLAKNYFDAENYQDIKFVSTKIEKESESNYILSGKLTIKNTTKQILIPLTIVETDLIVTIKANFHLNRRDYKVGGRSWILSNQVKIEIKHTIKK